jgi:hypothetical protein
MAVLQSAKLILRCKDQRFVTLNCWLAAQATPDTAHSTHLCQQKLVSCLSAEPAFHAITLLKLNQRYYFCRLHPAAGDTALHAGRSRVRFPTVPLKFSFENLSGRTMALGGERRPVRRADLTTFMCRLS